MLKEIDKSTQGRVFIAQALQQNFRKIVGHDPVTARQAQKLYGHVPLVLAVVVPRIDDLNGADIGGAKGQRGAIGKVQELFVGWRQSGQTLAGEAGTARIATGDGGLENAYRLLKAKAPGFAAKLLD